MTMFETIRPILFRFDPEALHNRFIQALEMVPIRGGPVPVNPALASNVAGLAFPSPVCLAAGFDKDARVPDQLLRLGFGAVEVGTLTPEPQAGNPGKRIFRLPPDQAVVNCMGFNNEGQEKALKRLAQRGLKPASSA